MMTTTGNFPAIVRPTVDEESLTTTQFGVRVLGALLAIAVLGAAAVQALIVL